MTGEIAASYAAGHLNAREAICAAFYRGLVVSRSQKLGSMAAVGMNCDDVRDLIRDSNLEQKIRVACINSPESTTVSGDDDGIESIVEILKSRSVFARKLKTDGKAYHSHHMLALGQEYQKLISQVFSPCKSVTLSGFQESKIRMLSSVVCEEVTSDVTTTTNYWRANLESPVRFWGAIDKLFSGHTYQLIEIGPHSVLEMPLKQIQKKAGLTDAQLQYNTALIRGKSGVDTLLNLIGTLYLQGHDIKFATVNQLHDMQNPSVPRGKVLTSLPNYRWQYDALLWNEPRCSTEFRLRKYPRHDLLGSQIPGGNGLTKLWRNVIRVKDAPWLKDHKLGDTIVFPAAGYIAVAVEALKQLERSGQGRSGFLLQSVNILAALPLSDDNVGVELFTEMAQAELTQATSSKARWRFSISSHANGVPRTHANGFICSEWSTRPRYAAIPSCNKAMGSTTILHWYEKFNKEGLVFGSEFRTLQEIHTSRLKTIQQSNSKTKLRLGGTHGSEYVLHPTTIDAMLQTAIIAQTSGRISELRARVPVALGQVKIVIPDQSRASGLCDIRATGESVGFESTMHDMELLDSQEQVVASMKDVRAVAYHGAQTEAAAPKREPVIQVVWRPDVSKASTLSEHAMHCHFDKTRIAFQQCSAEHEAANFSAALDMALHKNPNASILDLGAGHENLTRSILDSLRLNKSSRRCKSYVQASSNKDGGLLGTEMSSSDEAVPSSMSEGTKCDILLLPNVMTFFSGKMMDSANVLSRSQLPSAQKITGSLFKNSSRRSILFSAPGLLKKVARTLQIITVLP